jgi:hypothetical protein
MLQTLQWPTLEERRARIKATMMYSIVNGLVAIPPTELHTSTTTARFIVLDTIRIWFAFFILVDVDIPAEILLNGNPEVFGRFHFF